MIEHPWDDKKEYEDRVLVGVDSVGNGALAGPVVACACVIDLLDAFLRESADDSKKVAEARRYELAERYRKSLLFHAFCEKCPCEITGNGPHKSALQAMGWAANRVADQAYRDLEEVNKDLPIGEWPALLVIVDGNARISTYFEQETIPKADGHFLAVAAASIMAKAYRDKLMLLYDEMYPNYGFGRNKGYGTREHVEAIKQHGLCPIHRVAMASNARRKKDADG